MNMKECLHKQVDFQIWTDYVLWAQRWPSAEKVPPPNPQHLIFATLIGCELITFPDGALEKKMTDGSWLRLENRGTFFGIISWLSTEVFAALFGS